MNEIRSLDTDTYAPHARIGWVQKDDNGGWVALLPDLNDITTDNQPVKTTTPPYLTREGAVSRVRNNYRRWVRRQG